MSVMGFVMRSLATVLFAGALAALAHDATPILDCIGTGDWRNLPTLLTFGDSLLRLHPACLPAVEAFLEGMARAVPAEWNLQDAHLRLLHAPAALVFTATAILFYSL